MNKLVKFEKFGQMFIAVSLVFLVSACSGGPSETLTPEESPFNATIQEDQPRDDSRAISEDQENHEFTPTILDGLDIVYSDDESQADLSDEAFVAEQWTHMQNCMMVSAMEPVVSIVEGKITPLDTSDDVVRHIDGLIQASANVTDIGASVQIRRSDFDGSIGVPGSYLRSIFGRYLWFSNGYSERDYPYECAKRT